VGDGTTTNRTTAVRESTSGTDWASVSAGRATTCATRTTGTVWCWGANSSGQVGDGTTTTRTSPTQAGSATTYRAVATGAASSCAVRTDATVWCWGTNASGVFGNGTVTTGSTSPVQVRSDVWDTGGHGGVELACRVLVTMQAGCSGTGEHGQLGVVFGPVTPTREVSRATWNP
jgi:alpha-tubulin suppressor-like RCC1 family protein